MSKKKATIITNDPFWGEQTYKVEIDVRTVGNPKGNIKVEIISDDGASAPQDQIQSNPEK